MGSLADVKGRMKQAAIDAWMAENIYTQLDDKYVATYGPAEQYEVSRPGESGPYTCTVTSDAVWGMGYSEEPEDTATRIEDHQARLQEGWDQITTSIDDSVTDWEELPEASSMDAVDSACASIISKLGGATMNEASSVTTVGGDLAAAMSRMFFESDCIASPALNDFKTRYIDEGGLRSLRLTAMVEVIQQATLAEQNVLLKAEEDLNKRLEGHVEAFKALSGRGDGDVKAVLAVVGAAIAGAALFVPSGGTSALVLAGGGILVGLADKLIPTPAADGDDTISFSDVEGGLSSLSSSLRELSGALQREETSLRTALNETADSVRGNSAQFMLTPAPIYELLPAADLYVEPARAYNLARSYMPNAAEHARGQADPVIQLGTLFSETTTRPYTVGLSSNGPGNAVTSITTMASTLLQEFAYDLDNGAHNLDLAIQDYEAHEASTATDLQAVADQIASGATHNGTQDDALITPSYGAGGVSLRQLME